MNDILPAMLTDQIAAFGLDQPPTYELLEKHIALLTTTILCLTADMTSEDYLYLAFSHAETVLVKELGYPPHVVARCLEQLQAATRQQRKRSLHVKVFGQA